MAPFTPSVCCVLSAQGVGDTKSIELLRLPPRRGLLGVGGTSGFEEAGAAGDGRTAVSDASPAV